jgi:hypothetical protein
MERCHEIAGIAARLGAEAMQWSSATGAGQSLGVFVERRRPGSHAEILRSIDLSNEILISVAAGASLMTQVSALGDLPIPYQARGHSLALVPNSTAEFLEWFTSNDKHELSVIARRERLLCCGGGERRDRHTHDSDRFHSTSVDAKASM